jgi:glucose-1-phosphate cytidylyltransferase
MEKLEQALILCGGKGERLKPITDSIPKPLVKINGIPLLGYQINYLEKRGIRKFVIATGYKSHLINTYIKENYSHLEVNIVDSGDVDIMKRIYDCMMALSEEFLLCYGDTLADINIYDLYNFHKNHNGKVTVSTHQLTSQFGIVKMDENNLVVEFLEKPKLDVWINIGYFIFDKSIVTNGYKNYADFISKLAFSRDLFSYKHNGFHLTVNTINELKDAELNIKNFK